MGAALSLLFGAVAWGSLVDRGVPRTFGVLAALAVPLNLALAGATRRHGTMSPSGPIGMASLAHLGLTLTTLSIWMLVASRRAP